MARRLDSRELVDWRMAAELDPWAKGSLAGRPRELRRLLWVLDLEVDLLVFQPDMLRDLLDEGAFLSSVDARDEDDDDDEVEDGDGESKLKGFTRPDLPSGMDSWDEACVEGSPGGPAFRLSLAPWLCVVS